MKEATTNKALSLKTLTKSTVWDVQENDIFRMLEAADKDVELKDNLRHVADIMELFATGFFVLYTAEMWIAFGYSMFNVLLLSLAVVLAVYKIIFFIRGK